MYQSVTEICSAALLSLGDDPIDSLDDPSASAKTCKALWPMVFEAELTEHVWRCSLRRGEYAPLAEAPAFGWKHQFKLPSDCLRVLEVTPRFLRYQVESNAEGSVILSDTDVIRIVYVTRDIPVGSWSAGLVSALVARMAAELALSSTGKKVSADVAWEAYWRKVPAALAVDGQQGTPDLLEDRALVDVRL